MGLETGNVVGDLNAANPLGSDPKSTSDDHHRLTKKVLRQSFAGFTGAILVTGTDTGTINSYVLTPATPLLAYGQEMVVVLKPTNSNTGASTLNISGLGAVSILGVGGSPLIASELVAGIETVLVYNGTAFQLANVSKAYIDDLSFAGSLPSTPQDGAVIRSVNGVTQWAYVSPVLPLGQQIAEGQLVAADQNGNSIAVGTVTETVALVSTLNVTYTKPLENGNLVHAYIEGGGSDGKFSILSTSGTVLYGPITIDSSVSNFQCWPLTNGNFVVTWVKSTSMYFAIYSNSGSLILSKNLITASVSSGINCAELTNGNLVFGYRITATGYPAFVTYTQAGAIVTGETIIESTIGSAPKVVGLSTGHILFPYVVSNTLKFAKYTNAGTSVISPTTVATGTSGNNLFMACEQTNGNYSFVYANSSFYPCYAIVNTAFNPVYASQIIEQIAISGSDFYDIGIVPLTGGSCAVTWQTSTTPRVTIRNATGAETLAPFAPTANTTGSLCIAKTLVAASNGFYLSWDATYPSFMGAFNNNFIAGISAGYSTTKQLINVFGQYDAGTSILNTLEKNTNYIRTGNRIVF